MAGSYLSSLNLVNQSSDISCRMSLRTTRGMSFILYCLLAYEDDHSEQIGIVLLTLSSVRRGVVSFCFLGEGFPAETSLRLDDFGACGEANAISCFI